MTKKLFFILFIFLFSENLFSQVVDTCFVGDTSIFYVKNQQKNALLFWEISGGEILSENPTENDSLVVFWQTEGTQTISVYEETQFNCIGELANIEILVQEKQKGRDIEIALEIPNVFTPNGDNKNDYFSIKAEREPDYFLLLIQNRWGRKVFESNKISNKWDGTTKGEKCSEGIYYYVIHYQSQEKREQKNGFVHLYR